jgi:hypothetical protein
MGCEQCHEYESDVSKPIVVRDRNANDGAVCAWRSNYLAPDTLEDFFESQIPSIYLPDVPIEQNHCGGDPMASYWSELLLPRRTDNSSARYQRSLLTSHPSHICHTSHILSDSSLVEIPQNALFIDISSDSLFWSEFGNEEEQDEPTGNQKWPRWKNNEPASTPHPEVFLLSGFTMPVGERRRCDMWNRNHYYPPLFLSSFPPSLLHPPTHPQVLGLQQNQIFETLPPPHTHTHTLR